MNSDRIAGLETLFAARNAELEGKEFTHQVMSRTRRIRNYLLLTVGVLAIVSVVSLWLFDIPIPAIVIRVSEALTTTLFDLGDSWTAWVFSPVNNVGGLLLVSWKALRIIRKKVIKTL